MVIDGKGGVVLHENLAGLLQLVPSAARGLDTFSLPPGLLALENASALKFAERLEFAIILPPGERLAGILRGVARLQQVAYTAKDALQVDERKFRCQRSPSSSRPK